MYLKNLSLRGFKTFADKTVIEFHPPGSITAIVGPNGCGKSNLVDAIRWVLGEQNPKELRSSALEEVIFAGSSARKPLSLAEVSIDLDNSDNKIKTEFGEISIKRRTFRSGDSEFFINKANCRLKDIKDLFLDTGLGGGSYSIISQGKVDSILSSKPEDRREIFEEAAKINKYKFRKTAAERKLISTEQNMLRIADLKSEIANQIANLEEQSKKAAQFTELKEKLKVLEVGMAKKQINSIMEKKKTVDEKINAFRSQMALGLNLTEQLEMERTSKKESLRILNGDIEGLRLAISQSKLSYEENKSLILLEKEKKRNLEERLEEAKTQFEDLSSKLSSLKEQEKELKAELTELDASQSASLNELGKVEKEFDQVRLVQEKLELELNELKSRILEKESTLSGERNELIELESNLRLAQEEIKHDESLINKLEAEKQVLSIKISELAGIAESLDDQLLKNKNEFASKAVQTTNETLKASFRGVHGPLASLIGGNLHEINLEVEQGSDITVKSVSLNGELVLTDGSITGGSLKEKLGNILNKEKEISTLIEHARTNKEAEGKTLELRNVEEELELTRRSLVAREKEINDISLKRGTLFAAVNSIEAENKGLNVDLTSMAKRMNEIIKEKEMMLSVLAERKSDYAGVYSRFESKQGEIEKIFSDIRSINDAVTSVNREEIEQKLVETSDRIKNLEVSLPKLTEEEMELANKIGSMINDRAKLEEGIEVLEGKLSGGMSEDRLIRDALSKEEVAQAKLDGDLNSISEKMFGEYNMAVNDILSSSYGTPSSVKSKEEAEILRRSITDLGPVNLLATEEFEKARERFNFIETQFNDLVMARENLSNLILELDEKARADFIETLKVINRNFSEIFATLFEGGEAKLEIPEGEDILEGGIEIIARPGGKRWLNLSAMSGGERALTAIALLFALLKTHPSPFCLLDEADSALDEANIHRYAKLLKEFSRTTQVVLITHNKQTMEIADAMYGITMEEPGISKVISVKLAKAA